MESLKNINNIVFVSDVDITSDPQVHDNVRGLTTITPYSNLFVNRSMEDLSTRNIHKIWINIREKEALGWLKLHVLSKKERDYNVFCVYRQAGGIDQKWIAQCKPDVVIEFEKIALIKALNFEDFVNDMVAHGIEIAKPLAHKWLSCIFTDRVSKN